MDYSEIDMLKDLLVHLHSQYLQMKDVVSSKTKFRMLEQANEVINKIEELEKNK